QRLTRPMCDFLLERRDCRGLLVTTRGGPQPAPWRPQLRRAERNLGLLLDTGPPADRCDAAHSLPDSGPAHTGGKSTMNANPPTNASGTTDDPRLLQHTFFGQQVREALAHLHDVAYLQHHPLAQLLVRGPGLRPAQVGPALQERLRQAIAAQEPSADTPSASKAWVRHQLLRLRYLEGMEVAVIAARVGISHSEYYREHRCGLDAIIAALDPDGLLTDGSRVQSDGRP